MWHVRAPPTYGTRRRKPIAIGKKFLATAEQQRKRGSESGSQPRDTGTTTLELLYCRRPESDGPEKVDEAKEFDEYADNRPA
jgi:hypothetical protein